MPCMMFSNFTNLSFSHRIRLLHTTAVRWERSRKTYQIHDHLSEVIKAEQAQAANEQLQMQRSTDASLQFTPFRQYINQKREMTKRSILVQVKSKFSAEDLYKYCSTFGSVKGMHFHQNVKSTNFSDFYVVEFDSKESLNEVIQQSHHQKDPVAHSLTIPVHSPFMWFSGNGTSSKGATQSTEIPVYLPIHENSPLLESELSDHMLHFPTLDEQMVELYKNLRMTDIGHRLRFLACEQIERSISGMFPRAEVLPFGSSVNSFGKFDGDQDMVINFDNSEESSSSASRLLFHAKGGNNGNHRQQIQRYCDQIANILQCFLPGCQNVQNILHARVPIIKYEQHFLGLDCDVSTGTLSGYYMSELLYIYGELDWRVRPLVFTVRRWAREQGLVQDIRPTTYFTNFALTLMVIFFLQNKHKMLPPYRELVKLADPTDEKVCEDGVSCTFLRDISGLQPQLNKCWDNDLTVWSLFQDFLEFYALFNYKANAVCVVSGELQPKRKEKKSRNVSYFLDITNPLEPDLNVSANVQDHAVRKLIRKCIETRERLDKVDMSEVNLLHLLSGEGVPNVRVKVADLYSKDKPTKGNLEQGRQVSLPSEDVEEKKPTKKGSKYSEEKRRQEELKKKYLRVPKVREMFKPKF